MTEARKVSPSLSRTNYKSCTFRMVFVGLLLMVPMIPAGMTISYSAIALPQTSLNLDQGSWFASISSIACPLGQFVSGAILDKYGRKPALFVSVIPNIIGWMALSKPLASLTTLYVGRILTGFSLGAASLPSIIYGAECVTINHHAMRGSVSAWSTVAMSLGTLLNYATGAIMLFNQVAFVAACISIASFILLLIFIPESPSWLYRKGRIGDAEIAQRKLGIYQPILVTIPILSQLSRRAMDEEFRLVDSEGLSPKSLLVYLRYILRKEVYKPLAITIAFLFFCQFSGNYCVAAYMIDFFQNNEVEISPYSLSVVSGIVSVVAVVAVTFLLPSMGVRLLAAISALGMAAMFSVLIVADVRNWAYLHIGTIWMVTLFANLGMSSLPYAILGEVFPMGAKGYASLSLVAASIFNFTVLKLFPYGRTVYGSSIFIVFVIVNACCVIFVWAVLPETVGKTMDEINNEFHDSREENKFDEIEYDRID